MKKLQRFWIYLAMAFSISFLFASLYFFFPKSLLTIDYVLRDTLFKFRGEVEQSGNVVIVDIDDKSLAKIGHWPWSRDILANLLEKLGNAEVGLVAFDVIFAEEDNTSPHIVLKKIGIKHENVQNYDEMFVRKVMEVPTILGYQFSLEENEYSEQEIPLVPAIFIKQNAPEGMEDYITKAYGTILNIPILQDNAYSSGFVNNISSLSGVVRYLPLVVSYNNAVYPSLSLEVVRAITGERLVYLDYSPIGMKQIRVGDFTIPTNVAGHAFINYKGTSGTFQYISALDILEGKFKKEDVEGKIVLVGASAAGLLDLRATPFDSAFPGVEIHANMIDNILSGEFISVPEYADIYNLLHIITVVFLAVFTMAYAGSFFIAVAFGTLIYVDGYLLFRMLFQEGMILNILLPLSAVVFTSISVILVNNLFISRSEKQTREKIHQIESILSSILMPILIISKETKKVLYSNKYASKQYGLTIDSKDEMSIDDVYENKAQEEIINNLLENHGVVDNLEQEFITKADKKFTALLSVVPIEFGYEDAHITTVTDITKQKNVENEIRKIHNNVRESIKFASLIQGAIVPDNTTFEKFFDQYFAIWRPRDIVGGDIYFVEEISDSEVIVMVFDGAGHGVPGAFLTLLVKAISSQIMVGIKNKELSYEPNMILQYFNQGIKTMLKQEKGSTSNTGFDGGVLYYNKNENYCLFAGAKADLYVIQDGVLSMVEGDRKNVGFVRTKFDQKYTTKRLEITQETRLYMITDGIVDQEGKNDSRFSDELFEQTILENNLKDLTEQKDIINSIFDDFKQGHEQSDDMTVVGLKLTVN